MAIVRARAFVRGHLSTVPQAHKDGESLAVPHLRSLALSFVAVMHADPTYPLLPVFAFLGFVVGLIPLPWHLQAWNAGTCVYMIWASFACLIQFVNAIVWKETALSVAPVWCDICECPIFLRATFEFSWTVDSDEIHHRGRRWHTCLDPLHQQTSLQYHFCPLCLRHARRGMYRNSSSPGSPSPIPAISETPRHDSRSMHFSWPTCPCHGSP